MWTSIVQGLIQGLGKLLLGWLEKEHSHAMEWEAKAREHQMKSTKEAREKQKVFEAALEKARKEPLPTVEGWNAG